MEAVAELKHDSNKISSTLSIAFAHDYRYRRKAYRLHIGRQSAVQTEELLVDGRRNWELVERVHDLVVEHFAVFVVTYTRIRKKKQVRDSGHNSTETSECLTSVDIICAPLQ